MKRRDLLRSAALSGVCFSGLPIGSLLAKSVFPRQENKQRVLFFTRNVGYEHSVVHRSGNKLSFAEQQLTELLGKSGITVECEKDGRIFDGNIDHYDAFVFYCNNDLTAKNDRNVPPMTQNGLERLLQAIAAGKGFMGFHSTSACWRTPGEKNQNRLGNLSPFLKMLGGEFIAHGAQQEAMQRIVAPDFPGVQDSPPIFRMHEEYYGLKNFSTDLHVILTQETKGMKGQWYQRPPYPSTWARKHEQGRVFYTALGHREDVWTNQRFQQIITGALSWILKNVDADITPNMKQVTPQAYALTHSNRYSWQSDDDQLTLLEGDRIVWRFNHGTDQGKPFFDPLNLPGLGNLTWEAPPDHAWHHGLWFSWKLINGVNYWEEDPKTGLSDGRTTWKVVSIKRGKDFSARIELKLNYSPNDQSPVLTERRVIEISPPESDGGYQIDWTGEFTAKHDNVELDRTPLPDQPNGKIYGGYAGLSVRLSKQAAQFKTTSIQNPPFPNEKEPNDSRQPTRMRFPSQAVDYGGTINNAVGGIAILDHPDNLNAPSPWYVIRDTQAPMTYFSPAVIQRAPHRMEADDAFTLNYRIIVHRGHFDSEALVIHYDEFAKSSSATPPSK